MKKILLTFLAIAASVFGAANDIYIIQRNPGDTANTQRAVAPNASSFISTDASKLPIATKAVPAGDVVGTTDAQTLSAKTLTSTQYVGFDTAVTAAYAEGRVSWNATDHTIEVHTDDSGTRIQVGQEMVIRARNSTGSTLANGKPVYVSGATGNRPTITLADADEETKSVNLIGLVTTTGGIANNADGYVTVFGLVRDVNTNSWNEGDTLYLATGAAGGLTNVKPTSGYVVRVGFVTIKNLSNGVILVAPQVSGSVYGDTLNLIASASAARTSLDVYSKSETDTRTNSRKSAQAWVFDGTAGATVTGVPAFGTNSFTMVFDGSIPSLTSSVGLVDSASLSISVRTDGSVRIYERISVANVYVSPAGSIVAGKTFQLAYVRGQLYLNGSTLGSAFTDTGNYANPITSIGNSAYGYGLGALRVTIINAALSAAEVATLAETGRLPIWCHTAQVGQPAGVAVTAGSFKAGYKYRISNSGTTDFTLIGAANSTVGTEFTATGAGAGTGTATTLGCLLNLDADQSGSGNVWRNTNGTGDAIAPSSGVTWALPGTGSTRLRTTTATNGNQQLYGTSIFPTTSHILRVRAKAASGTPTVTLGNASGGSQIVSSVALTTAWKNLAIVSGGEITSTANLWAGSNSTDVVYWDIEVQSFNN